jgi:hypothetical protein
MSTRLVSDEVSLIGFLRLQEIQKAIHTNPAIPVMPRIGPIVSIV